MVRLSTHYDGRKAPHHAINHSSAVRTTGRWGWNAGWAGVFWQATCGTSAWSAGSGRHEEEDETATGQINYRVACYHAISCLLWRILQCKLVLQSHLQGERW